MKTHASRSRFPSFGGGFSTLPRRHSCRRMAPRVLSLLNDSPLVKHDLPACLRVLPDRRPTSLTFSVLEQCVSQQVNIRAQSAAMKVRRLPHVGDRLPLSPLQFRQYTVPAVPAAGGAHFPEVSQSHILEVSPRSP